ncbi:MAG: CpsD/CapB family tyrosine-protein kinase [Dethiobacteria bacterium]|jgi:protein-tyrosine kinase
MALFKHKKHGRVRRFDLVTQTHPQSPPAEAFRTLRTNLGFACGPEECRTIMVSSPGPLEGKSTVVSNLAIALAQAGNNVILVDCDLRKPVQHRIFNLSNRQGLTNCLLGQAAVEDVVQACLTNNLSLLTSGPMPPNPAEILSAPRTGAFWASLREEYDYVLVDTPPVLAVTDALILAGQLEGAILTLRAGSTRSNMAVQARNQLTRAGAHLLGVVLNMVKMDSPDYQYNYYYYYGHYGQSDTTKAAL